MQTAAAERMRRMRVRRAGAARSPLLYERDDWRLLIDPRTWPQKAGCSPGQIGRVIIQDNVEIGANTTIDRGALRDTVIGEGTKIDNLVQIGHNVVIGRHCIIVAQTGISGSAELGDFVALGGQVGVVGHVRIGAGAQIAASSRSKPGRS